MYTLHHYYLCPSSRFVRLILEEYKLKYILQLENYWKPKNFCRKSHKINEKIESENALFLNFDFLTFGGPFWEVLGASWASLGRLWASKMRSKRARDIDPRHFLCDAPNVTYNSVWAHNQVF